MGFISYISIIAVPFTIFFIVSYALAEKVKVFDSFLSGAKEGMTTVVKIFPSLVGLFLAVSFLRESGFLDFIASCLSPIIQFAKIPIEILPLVLVRPISGSAATAVAMDIMQTYGVDTVIRFYCFNYHGGN